MKFSEDAVAQPIESKLQDVQHIFDKYQEEFQAKPRNFFCLELCGEAGELANLEKKVWKGKDIDPARVADEAADVLIALMNYTNAAEIDLGSAVATKLRRIEQVRQQLEQEGKKY